MKTVLVVTYLPERSIDDFENVLVNSLCELHGNILLHMFRSGDEKETLTVVFHAILSEKFGKLDDGTKIVIRGESPVFEGWNKDSVVFVTER